MSTARPLNYTTTITATKTVGEIGEMLGAHGANGVMVRYADRRPVGVSFTLAGPHGDRAFTLPVDVAAMEKALNAQYQAGQVQRRYATPEQAERTAWRVIKDWLAAQLTLVAAHMATLDQVMLPYLHVDGEITLYAAYQAREQRAIEAATS